MFRRKTEDAGHRGSSWRNEKRPQADTPHVEAHDYATILMLTAVASAAGNIATAVIELGRSAGWWH